MKKIISFILALTILTSFVVLPASCLNASNQKELTVAFTHDLHSYIDTKEYTNDGKTTEVGGFAKIKTIMDNIKSENKNTLVVDGGDFSMGTLFQTVYEQEAIELRMLGLIGYDATTFGNHEFDYSCDGLTKMLTSAMNSNDPLPKIVSNNIDWKNSKGEKAASCKKAMDKYGVRDYIIIKKGDVKIAVFGGMGTDSIACAPNSGLAFSSFVDKSKATVSKIKEKENPDIIVCLSHSGTSDDHKNSEDEILAKEVPDIDVIISGHTHTALEKPITVGNTVIGSCGEYGQNVGQINLKQNKDGSWSVEKYKLIAVNENIKSNTETSARIEDFRKYVDEFLNEYGYNGYSQVIANSPYNFTDVDDLYANHVDQSIGNLITDSLIYAVKQAEGENYDPVDVSIVPVGIIRSTFNKGDIKISDVYEVMSLGMGKDGKTGYPLASVYLTGKELKTVAEVDASITTIMDSAQLYCSGLQYTFNPNRLLLNRVTDVKLKTQSGKLKELDDNKLYRVVADLYSSQMLSAVMDKSYGLLKIVPKDKDGKAITDFNKTIIYDKNGSEVKEWLALAEYLESFDKVNGIPTVPAKYSAAQSRKIVDNSKNITDLLKNPNKIFFIVLAVVIILIALIVLLIKLIIKIVKKVKSKNKEKISIEEITDSDLINK